MASEVLESHPGGKNKDAARVGNPADEGIEDGAGYARRTGSVIERVERGECFVAMDSERHMYRLKWWVRAGYLFLGVLLGGGGLTLVFIAIMNHGWPGGFDLPSFAAMILCPLLGYVFLALALRSKVILDGDRLTVRYYLGEDSAQIGKIMGYRIVRSNTGTYWALRLRNGDSITIMQSYAVDDYFRDFLSRLKPLGKEDEPDSLISS
jgi:hypothetical protein